MWSSLKSAITDRHRSVWHCMNRLYKKSNSNWNKDLRSLVEEKKSECKETEMNMGAKIVKSL